MPRPRLSTLIVTLIALGAVGFALTLRVAESKSRSGFWSDEATYHSMAWSLAYDGDIRYERQDLERVYAAGYAGGPSGLFLVRNPDDGTLHYAKSFVYPLFAAPFVRLLGDNGFFLLHALLLTATLAAALAYARRLTRPAVAGLLAVTYVLGSAVTIYFFWMTPEWFNFAILFLAAFLWLYKEPLPGKADRIPDGPGRGALSSSPGLLTGAWTDLAAAALFGIAIFSKPPNAVLVLPLLAWNLWRGRWARAVACGLVCAAVIGLFFGATWSAIGDWNYQGGDRRQFNVVTSYPYLDEDKTFDSVGIPMTTNLEDFAGALPPPATLGRDLLYVWIGRNGGLIPYMFPAVAALLLFLTVPTSRWRSPQGLLVLFVLLEILAILLVVRVNWIGGGGTIGSRYFVNVYPLLFFVLPAAGMIAAASASWIVWGLFVAQIVLNPFSSSANPSFHTKSFPYELLPAELTLLHNLPFNTNPRARRVQMDDPPTFYTYFLDDDTYFREGALGGFWVVGGAAAEIVFRTGEPVEALEFEIRNRSEPNRVTVRHGGRVHRVRLDPDEKIDLRLPAIIDHVYDEHDTPLYRVVIASEAATIPAFDTPGSADRRLLGVLVRPSVDPPVPLGGSE